jgi:DNA polymerase-1
MSKSLFGRQAPILAWDVANLAWRCYHKFKNLTWKDNPSGHVFGATRTILALYKKQPVPPILWFALEGRSEKRLKIFPDYKANRPQRNFNPIADIEKLVRLMPGVVFHHPKWEADDLLAMMTNKKVRNDKPIIIVTGDHDLWKYVGKAGVTVWNKDHAVDPIEISSIFGVTKGGCIPLIKALFGDPSDNLPPASKQTRQQEIRDLIEEKGLTNLKQLRASLPDLSPKVSARLEKDWEIVQRNWKVVKLSSKLNSEVQQYKGPKSYEPLVEYLRKFGCKSLYEEIKLLWQQ